MPLLTPDPAQARTFVTTETPVTATAPITPATSLLQQTPAANRTDLITANLPHGITISYPRDWTLEETGVPVTRDYGRDVLNIANL